MNKEKECCKDAIEEEYASMAKSIRQQHFYILNYLLNKNSHSLKNGGIDGKGLMKDIEEFEQYLCDF